MVAAEEIQGESAAVLSPVERISEVLFGLIMVLTFTGSLSAATAGREEVREMLIGALGCNLAWAIIDGAFYLMNQLTERRRNLRLLGALRSARGEEEARAVIAEAVPPRLASWLRTSELAYLKEKAAALPDPSVGPLLTRKDWRGALGVFLLVFLSTFPVVIPFFLMQDAVGALRVSNLIALIMLFAAGASLGRYSGGRPVLMGSGTMLIGMGLVSITIALGG